MRTIRTKFVKDFNEDLAEKLEAAAEKHSNGVNNKNKGSDPFKWVLLICIGYQCFEVKSYRKHHDITEASFTKISNWIKKNGKLDTHDGDCDYLSLFCGKYEKYMPKRKK